MSEQTPSLPIETAVEAFLRDKGRVTPERVGTIGRTLPASSIDSSAGCARRISAGSRRSPISTSGRSAGMRAFSSVAGPPKTRHGPITPTSPRFAAGRSMKALSTITMRTRAWLRHHYPTPMAVGPATSKRGRPSIATTSPATSTTRPTPRSTRGAMRSVTEASIARFERVVTERSSTCSRIPPTIR